jgi:hypothetical protein
VAVPFLDRVVRGVRPAVEPHNSHH